jgi:hypothetical protein
MVQAQFISANHKIEWRFAPQNGIEEINANVDIPELINPSEFIKKMRRYAAGDLKEVQCACCSCA